jgi:LuxR family maltose regulon positive regulatory protein
LIERLNEGLSAGRKLTLISAPAGFGKTTQVSEWIASCGQPVAWLSLDKGDNDPTKFLAYLVAALQTIMANIGEGVLGVLQAPQPSSAESILTVLLNEITTLPDNFVLVLDDYHVVDSKPVDEALTFLLKHLPPQMHLVIATREDPHLPLTRLRARGQLTELRAADLRFTPSEAAEFLNQMMNLNLSEEDIAALETRTEGWIAGLQLAAISMQGHQDTASFIKAFTGSHHFVLDYLIEEVLEKQSESVQAFLLRTSILDRMCGPLCDAVLPAPSTSGQETLEYLEHANLFIVPLDNERRWYRYHHLFAELLRQRLGQSLVPGEIAELHIRASEWYENNGLAFEAIHHASMAPDDEMVERLIEQNYLEMMSRGEMSWVRLWMGKLSKELVYRRPWLCLYEAMKCSWFGQIEEANLLLNEAEKHIRAESLAEVSAPGAQSMLGYHAYVKSRVTAMQGDNRRAIEFCLTARKNVPADDLGKQNEIVMTLGFEYFLVGDFINANRTFYEIIRSGYFIRAINNPVAAYAILARIHIFQGQLHDAYDLLQKAAQLIHEADGQKLGATGLEEVGIAELLCEWNDLEAALVRIKQGLDFLPWWGKTDDIALAYNTLSRIHLAYGNWTEAVGAIEKAAQLIQTCSVFSEARSAIQTTQVKMWLVQGDWLAVDRWTATLENHLSSHDPFRFEDELTHITQARVFIAQKKLDEAIRLLSRLEENAQSDGRMGRLLETMILKALAMQRMGNTVQADIALTKCLTLAEPEGYLRIFLDEGQPMQMLLAKRLAHAGADPLREYAIHLLSQFNAEQQPITSEQEKASPTGNLVEPLSPRELEVFRLLRTDLNGPEIARECMVSMSTIRTHIQNIYAKLGVNNRRAAVRRAEELDLF